MNSPTKRTFYFLKLFQIYKKKQPIETVYYLISLASVLPSFHYCLIGDTIQNEVSSFLHFFVMAVDLSQLL